MSAAIGSPSSCLATRRTRTPWPGAGSDARRRRTGRLMCSQVRVVPVAGLGEPATLPLVVGVDLASSWVPPARAASRSRRAASRPSRAARAAPGRRLAVRRHGEVDHRAPRGPVVHRRPGRQPAVAVLDQHLSPCPRAGAGDEADDRLLVRLAGPEDHALVVGDELDQGRHVVAPRWSDGPRCGQVDGRRSGVDHSSSVPVVRGSVLSGTGANRRARRDETAH